jgi:hypothetical protein
MEPDDPKIAEKQRIHGSWYSTGYYDAVYQINKREWDDYRQDKAGYAIGFEDGIEARKRMEMRKLLTGSVVEAWEEI